jgi:hypothetical protein
MTYIEQFDKIPETLKAMGIPNIEELMEQDEDFKKEVNEGLNQSLNDYIVKNYDKYDNERTV